MRIDDVSRLPESQASGKAQQTGAHEQPHSAHKLDEHADISAVAQANSAEPPNGADPKRLETLRLQVQSGKYEVSAPELASKLVDAHLRS